MISFELRNAGVTFRRHMGRAIIADVDAAVVSYTKRQEHGPQAARGQHSPALIRCGETWVVPYRRYLVGFLGQDVTAAGLGPIPTGRYLNSSI